VARGIVGLALLVGGGLVLYAVLALTLNAVDRAELKRLFRRRAAGGADRGKA